MKKLLAFLLLCMSAGANAQFTPGQLLTAGELNTQFALYAKLASATFTGPVTIPTLTVSTTATLPAQAANTLLGNASGSSASPSAVSVSNCSSSSSALSYTSGTGFGCNSSVNAATLGGATFASPGPVGSSTASTGAFTTLSASSAVSGSGFSTYLASPPAIGGTSANAGKFTTLQATSTITPSTTSGIVGTTAADNANAGSVGEYSTATTSGTSLSTGVFANATSFSLTAGDWDVTGECTFSPGASTTINAIGCGVSTTSATQGSFGTFNQLNATLATGNAQNMLAPSVRINVSSTTPVYLVAVSVFSTSTMSVNGIIRARRVR